MSQSESRGRHGKRYAGRSLKYQPKRAAMASNFHDALDPLDREILEGALDGALATLKEDEAGADLDSDEALETELRQELVEIACLHGVNDPQTLRDILLGGLSNKQKRR